MIGGPETDIDGVKPDGSRVAVASNATVEVLDGKTGQIVGKPAYFPGAVNGMDVAVKDSKRFAETKNWGYFNFNHSAPPYLKAASLRPVGECAGCHIANADEDMVYVRLYKPILNPLPR